MMLNLKIMAGKSSKLVTKNSKVMMFSTNSKKEPDQPMGGFVKDGKFDMEAFQRRFERTMVPAH
jgi:hypothetical protein